MSSFLADQHALSAAILPLRSLQVCIQNGSYTVLDRLDCFRQKLVKLADSGSVPCPQIAASRRFRDSCIIGGGGK